MDSIETKYPGPATYKAPYGCDNCGWSGTKIFDRGKVAPAIATCPKCGCNTAKKSVSTPYVPKMPPKRRVEPDDPWWPVPMPGPLNPWRRWPRDPWDPFDPRRKIYCGLEERCYNREPRATDYRMH